MSYIRLKETGPYPCPACSGTFSVGFTTQSDIPYLSHTVPTCPRYDAIVTTDDAITYIREARSVKPN